MVNSLQLLPPGHGGDTMSMSAAAQALARGLEAVSPAERAAVFEALAPQSGASERLAKKQFQSTWMGLGLGLLLGAGGLYLTGKTLGWCR
jgi:hypothetical protein